MSTFVVPLQPIFKYYHGERRCEYLQLPCFCDRVENKGGDVGINLYRKLEPI